MTIEAIMAASRLDKASETPLYAQLRDMLLSEIAQGRLSGGERLPPVRRLAELAGVNVMTVARAYKALTEAGAIAGRGALGTFVLPPPAAPTPAAPPPQDLSFARADYTGRDIDTFRRMVQAGDAPGVIPLTRAYPDASVIDTSGFEALLKEAIDSRPDYAYAYISPAGLPALRAAIARTMMASRGLSLGPDDIVVTSGGQQALNLVAQLLLSRGDVVVLERPTYFGALDLFRNLGVRTVGIDMLADGPDIAALEEAIKTHAPKLLFLMPNFQNPTGDPGTSPAA
jgi:2-aminoadipate transaminase